MSDARVRQRPLFEKNTEGVGESRGCESGSGILLRRGAEVFRRLFFTVPGKPSR
jgi:hypothetical protein